MKGEFSKEACQETIYLIQTLNDMIETEIDQQT